MNKKTEDKKKNELDELLDNENEDFKFLDEKQKISKGDKNKDIRFNPNMNRKEIDVATQENNKY